MKAVILITGIIIVCIVAFVLAASPVYKETALCTNTYVPESDDIVAQAELISSQEERVLYICRAGGENLTSMIMCLNNAAMKSPIGSLIISRTPSIRNNILQASKIKQICPDYQIPTNVFGI